jgi:ABC-type multidrug transport system fused ATPase/permease subunit
VHIKDGEKVAVVGENGSGKSTFISLLCGMFEAQSGSVHIGNTDMSANPADGRDIISVVFQDFAHYETSIRENIAISDKERRTSDAEILALLKNINVDDVVAGQKEGLNSQVGSFSDKANNLSGGQWQKISIARAAYRQKAKIMILDEPTSALDPVAEAQLYRDFTVLTGDRTTVLISHRLGITALVDRILVFDEGRIVEDGSHKQLMENNGLYARMYRAQAQWYV